MGRRARGSPSWVKRAPVASSPLAQALEGEEADGEEVAAEVAEEEALAGSRSPRTKGRSDTSITSGRGTVARRPSERGRSCDGANRAARERLPRGCAAPRPSVTTLPAATNGLAPTVTPASTVTPAPTKQPRLEAHGRGHGREGAPAADGRRSPRSGG